MNRREAVRTTKRLPRPDGISPRLWHGVKPILVELAWHMPDPFPSEARLARLTDYSVRSVKRYIKAAKDAGLITVEPFHHGRGWEHNRYTLTWLNGGQTVPYTGRQTVPLSSTSLRELLPPPSVEDLTAYGGVAAEALRLEEHPIWDLDGDWRPNQFPRKCDTCRGWVKRGQGWVGPALNGSAMELVHRECVPKWFIGSRPGWRPRTVGDIRPSVPVHMRGRHGSNPAV